MFSPPGTPCTPAFNVLAARHTVIPCDPDITGPGLANVICNSITLLAIDGFRET